MTLDLWGPAPQWLQSSVFSLSQRLRLAALPPHIHHLFLSFAFYQTLYSTVSPFLSRRLFPKTYPSLDNRTRLNWDIHVVALVQAIVISLLSLYVEFWDPARKEMITPIDRLYGYTVGAGTVGAMAAGYFLWDTLICLKYFKIFGVGMLAHGISALSVYVAGFRPFLNYYSSTFLLYELSSPFLNIHWFCDKLSLTGSSLQWYNGMLLLSSFFFSRLMWGSFHSVRFHLDTWNAWTGKVDYQPTRAAVEANATTSMDLAWPNVEHGGLPTWLYFTFVLSNITLNSLNWYWFRKMIEAVSKRFGPQKQPSPGKTPVLSDEVVVEAAEKLLLQSEVGGAAMIGEDEEVLRRRTRRA